MRIWLVTRYDENNSGGRSTLGYFLNESIAKAAAERYSPDAYVSAHDTIDDFVMSEENDAWPLA